MDLEKEKYRNDRNKQVDEVFMNVAKNIAELSHCKRAKVGCIIVGIDKNIMAYGFNGTPSGFDNNAEYELDGSLVTKPETLHSESNAIAKIAKTTLSSDGAMMYVTMSPCFECAKLIIQAGIRKVVYFEKYRDTKGLDLLEKCGIKTEQILNV